MIGRRSRAVCEVALVASNFASLEMETCHGGFSKPSRVSTPRQYQALGVYT
jgi:hypothetical protein